MGDSRLAKWFIKAELEALRLMAGLTPTELGRKLDFSAQSISNWETGVNVPKRSIVKDICGITGVDDRRKNFLIHVVDNYKSHDLVSRLDQRCIAMVEQAERTYGDIFKFEPLYIPGPVQLPAYHTEVLPVSERSPGGVKQKTRRRLMLESRKDRPRIQIAIGIDAFRYLDSLTHRDRQIELILEASKRQNWEIRIIDQAHRAMRGGFDMFLPSGKRAAGPPFVYCETLGHSHHFEGTAEIQLYSEVREEIWAIGKPVEEVLSENVQLMA